MNKDMQLSERKLEKLRSKMINLTNSLNEGNKRKAIGDINYMIDCCVALKYSLKAELEEEEAQ